MYQYVCQLLMIAAPWLSLAEIQIQARDISTVTGNDAEKAKMLVTTGAIETGFKERYTRCDCEPRECDDGAAISVYQLHSYWWGVNSRESICSSNLLATRIAAQALSFLRSRAGAKEALRIYVGRNVSVSDPRIKARWELWEKLSSLTM